MLKVVIAEDDLIIADLAAEALVAHGYDVCGIARTVEAAVMLCRRHKPDLALVDMRLADGGLGTEIAAQLGAGRPGILYATATVAHVVRTAPEGDACLAKPYSFVDLLRSLEIVAGMVATGKAMPPFPRGFQVLHPPIAAPVEPAHG